MLANWASGSGFHTSAKQPEDRFANGREPVKLILKMTYATGGTLYSARGTQIPEFQNPGAPGL